MNVDINHNDLSFFIALQDNADDDELMRVPYSCVQKWSYKEIEEPERIFKLSFTFLHVQIKSMTISMTDSNFEKLKNVLEFKHLVYFFI